MPLHINISHLEGKNFKDRMGRDGTCIGAGQNPDGTVFILGIFIDPKFPQEMKVITELIKHAVFQI